MRSFQPAGAVVLTASTNFQTYNIDFGGAASNVAKSRAYVINVSLQPFQPSPILHCNHFELPFLSLYSDELSQAPTGKRIEVKFPTLKTTDMENSCGKNGIEWKGKTDLRTRGVRLILYVRYFAKILHQILWMERPYKELCLTGKSCCYHGLLLQWIRHCYCAVQIRLETRDFTGTYVSFSV